MSTSLRGYIDFLLKEEEAVIINREVDPRFEASAVIEKIQKTINKAVVFNNLKGFEFPLVSNILGTYQRTAQLLRCGLSEINNTWNSKEREMDLYSPVEDGYGETDYMECAIHDIPALIYREKDAGLYFSAGMVLAKNPETGIRNLSFHRMQIVDDHKLRIRITPGNHLGICYDKAERMGKPLEVAILIGGHPAFMLAGSSRISLDQDELCLAGALIGEPVKLRKCRTIDLSVPLGVDFVIEGTILPHVREEEGPFGDFLGYYVPVMKNLVLDIKRVSRLKDCFSYGILAGSAEQDVLAGVPVAANIFKIVKGAIPSVVDVTCMSKLYHSVVKINQQFPGQARQAALAALACDPSQTKFCTVVDDDVNIYDPIDVQWATITRCRPDRDVFIVSDTPSLRRDPYHIYWGKMGIDATKPSDEEGFLEFERTTIPGADSIRLQNYLDL